MKILFFWFGLFHDDGIKWKHFSRYWPFVRGIHRSPVNFPHKGQGRGSLMFSLICALNKQLSKQSWGWWFETPSRLLWRHCNVLDVIWCSATPWGVLIVYSKVCSRADSRFAPSQWETALFCNDVSHRLDTSLESVLCSTCAVSCSMWCPVHIYCIQYDIVMTRSIFSKIFKIDTP